MTNLLDKTARAAENPVCERLPWRRSGRFPPPGRRAERPRLAAGAVCVRADDSPPEEASPPSHRYGRTVRLRRSYR